MHTHDTATDNTPTYSLGLPIALTIFCASLLIAYFETLAYMVPAWLSIRGPYSHSILLTLLVFSLLWRDRHSLSTKSPRFSASLVACLVVASALWFIFWAANIIIGQIFAVYILFSLGLWNMMGKGSYRKLFPIIGLLLFALPLWRPIQPALQELATTAVQLIIRATGIPVYVENNLITIPAGVFEIKGGCSGIGFLLVSISLTGFLSLYDRISLSKTLRMLVLSAVVALLANWIRIYLIILVGYYVGMDHPLISDHVGFGWIVYSVLFFPFLYYFTRTTTHASTEQALPSRPGARISILHVFLIVFCASFASVAAFTLNLLNQSDSPTPYSLPTTLMSFQKQEIAESYWLPVFDSSDYVERIVYKNQSGSEVQAFTASYINQHQNAEVINLHNSFTGTQMKAINKTTRKMQNDGPLQVTELTVQDPGGNLSVVWYWYYIGHVRAHTESSAILQEIFQKMKGHRNATAVALLVKCRITTCADARTALGRFAVEANFPNSIGEKAPTAETLGWQPALALKSNKNRN